MDMKEELTTARRSRKREFTTTASERAPTIVVRALGQAHVFRPLWASWE